MTASMQPPVRWAALVAAAYLLAGIPVAAAAAVLAGWHLWRPPRPTVLVAAAVAVLALVPVTWIAGNADRLGAASSQLVTANPWPGRLTAVALLLLVVGVARDVADVADVRQDVAERGAA